MIINKLIIVGLRVLEKAEFTFEPGMNLIVGVNGVGKSTILDALRMCLSRIFKATTSFNGVATEINREDFRFGQTTIDIICNFSINNIPVQYSLRKSRLSGIDGVTSEVDEYKPDISKVFSKKDKREVEPIVLYFSTRRAYTVDQTPSSSGPASAYYEALSINRDFNIREIADWLKVREVLEKEIFEPSRLISEVQKAVDTFLPGYSNLSVQPEKGVNRLMIKKGDQLIYVKQLSDGERGLLSIVVEIARRLVVANPGLENPIEEGEGVILVDELDLHLHPKWQRRVVYNLTRTFPRCQFIVTTHSPQIISAVEPEQIQVLKDDEVIVPDRSKGMDTNWVLRHIMGTEDRPDESSVMVGKVEAKISDGDFEAARGLMQDFIEEGYDLPEWTVLEAQMSRIETFEEE